MLSAACHSSIRVGLFYIVISSTDAGNALK